MAWLTRVESASMAPTLRPGALVPTRRLRRTTPVRRGDLVVAWSAETSRAVVKRVIGLPGEHVSIDGGRVSIDRQPLAEPYASASYLSEEYDVPPEHYFLLGDNRDASSDSRAWRQPFIERAQLRGRLMRREATAASRG